MPKWRVLGSPKEADGAAPRSFSFNLAVQDNFKGKATVGVKCDPACEERGRFPLQQSLPFANAVTDEMGAPASPASPLSLSARVRPSSCPSGLFPNCETALQPPRLVTEDLKFPSAVTSGVTSLLCANLWTKEFPSPK